MKFKEQKTKVKGKNSVNKGQAGQKGHYYRILPRTKAQAIEKRLMEKNLLSKLDPKGKENQRKKILRLFFSWVFKQSEPNPRKVMFWEWVKSLSPDNQNSAMRYKSMSYDFLDKLLSKKQFRDSIWLWTENIYLKLLTKSTEDEHTRYFLQFILSTIEVKTFIEYKKKTFLIPSYDISPQKLHILQIVEVPKLPGLYIEFDCNRSNCRYYRETVYGYIGNNICITFQWPLVDFKCGYCGQFVNVYNLGALSCKYILKGQNSEDDKEEVQDLTNCYNSVDEIHFFPTQSVIFYGKALESEEKVFLDELVANSVRDPTIPKKKYCKRKASGQAKNKNNDLTASVLGLEKEINELDSQIMELAKDCLKNKMIIEKLQVYVNLSSDSEVSN
ncbi:hypothetical protein SteCoe_13948 [Stentor coeruleus]|uniref:Uncharacterized protein n=1 Tax=Stentor coeruleus TaxID=5963 RepID=A0A1R2C7A3_9CILI|nr:hypothetical protein SteCoe_13948 [Stentor coeruleus]